MARNRAGRNLNSGLKRRWRKSNAMQSYDALPPPLRNWLASACLPWSPESALGIWTRAGGMRDPRQAVTRLNQIEQAMLRKDAAMWEA